MALLQNVLYLLIAILALGTIYAWYQFYKVVANKCDTCSVDLHKNPFKSKCFIGAIFFSISLALAIWVWIILWLEWLEPANLTV